MKAINKQAQAVMDRLTEGVDSEHPKKIDNGSAGIMAVHVEIVNQCEWGPIYSIAHYYEQNGDLMRDPDMEFLKGHDGCYYPIMYRQDGLGICQESVTFDDGQPAKFRRRMQADQAGFAGLWMRNIKRQQGLR